MIKFLVGAALASMCSAVCQAQLQNTHIATQGNCNGLASGSNITVTVRCSSALDKKQAMLLAKQYAEILRRIREENLSYEVVIDKLDSIQKGVNNLTSAAAPRHLSSTQLSKLQSIFNMAPAHTIELHFLMNNEEATGYAEDFAQGLRLQRSDAVGNMTMNPGIGVHLFWHPDTETGKMAPECALLSTFLSSEKIPHSEPEVQYQIGTISAPKMCTLVVGAKPAALADR